MALIEITPQSHDVDIDLAYADFENFTGAPIYAEARCYLHPEAEALLVKARTLAAVLGYRLKIFDAFRPVEAQWALWNHTPDPAYIADPRRGSPHSRGAAVDLTLLDGSGRALEMGTPFDDFTGKAHHGSLDIAVSAQRNRTVLLGIMTSAGWDYYRNEWWHYQLFDARRLPTISDSALPRSMMTKAATTVPRSDHDLSETLLGSDKSCESDLYQ
ncbi:MAG: D-alanyl-D-alanine dipeptidase [Rhodospirillales bacterium]